MAVSLSSWFLVRISAARDIAMYVLLLFSLRLDSNNPITTII